ncbi:MAG: hypothetical protein IH994_12365 [Proteobacteria bacterium]|nr:hypothetical protein [Pseudomonadota bacterium]
MSFIHVKAFFPVLDGAAYIGKTDGLFIGEFLGKRIKERPCPLIKSLAANDLRLSDLRFGPQPLIERIGFSIHPYDRLQQEGAFNSFPAHQRNGMAEVFLENPERPRIEILPDRHRMGGPLLNIFE